MYRRELRIYGTLGILYNLAYGLIWGTLFVYMMFGTLFGVAPQRGLEEEPPAAVSLTDFNRRTDVHAKDEVAVVGRFLSAEGIELTHGDETRRLFLFFGPDAAAEDTVVRAMVLLNEAEATQFSDQLTVSPNGETTIGGRRVTFPPFDREAEAELQNRNLTLSDQYIYIEPWLSGRKIARVGFGQVGGVLSLFFLVPALYYLIIALERWQNNRGLYASLSPSQVAALKRSMRDDRTSQGILGLIVLIGVGVAIFVSKYQ